MSCNGVNMTLQPGEAAKDPAIRMGSRDISIAYQTGLRDRPLAAIRIRAAAGDPRRGWLTAGGQTAPGAGGRRGGRGNKSGGGGGGPQRAAPPRPELWGAAPPRPRRAP